MPFSETNLTVYGQPTPLSTPLDWLCIAPHPDDAEIGAGGTLIRLAAAGRRVGVLELTEGEKGTQGNAEQRQSECIAAAQIMQLAWRGQLGLPDGALREEGGFALALAQALRQTRPRVLLCPHYRDRHPDHVGAYHLCKRAIYLASLQKAELSQPTHSIERVLLYQGNCDIRPDVLLDIGPSTQTWQAAIKAHVSQFAGQYVSETVTPEIIERRKARLSYWGTLARSRYAEAFEAETPLLLDPQVL